ncbi:MAG TPA: T9SS type A sorting domain-containing protein [Bacteroidia bacterium]
MTRNTLLLIFLFINLSIYAQKNESEPNNNFSGYNTIEKDSTILASINNTTDLDDIFGTSINVAGTVKLMITATNNGSGNAYLYLVGYDGRKASGQILARYVGGTSSIPSNTTVRDTIYLYGRGIDSFFARFYASAAFSYSFKYTIENQSIPDLEPNNDLAQSFFLNQNQLSYGQVGYNFKGLTDPADCYALKLQTDGTVKLKFNIKNAQSTSGYVYLRVYDGRKGNGNIYNYYVGNTSTVGAGKSLTDSVILPGRGIDSMFIKLESSGAFQYDFEYDILDTSLMDAEDNGTIESAINIVSGDTKVGHINYLYNGTADAFDYYKTLIPEDGTVKIIVNGQNMGGTNGYLYIYGYDGRKLNGTILSKYISNTSNVANRAMITDTIILNGRAVDSFYMRIQSSTAFQYEIKYEVVDKSNNDVEPNGNFADAIEPTFRNQYEGHINYLYSGTADSYDYYRLVLPTDGTLKIPFTATNMSGNNSYIFGIVYDSRKGSGQIFSKYLSNNSSIKDRATIVDTIVINGLAKDTFYFRIEANSAFKYKFSFDVTDTSINDIETNDVYTKALNINEGEKKFGHTEYFKKGVSDNYDYYRTLMKKDGTIRLIINGTNMRGAIGYMFITVFDGRNNNGQIFSKYISNNSSVPNRASIKDTIYIYGRAVDTMYFRMQSSGAFQYDIQYDIVDTSATDGNNENFAQATAIERSKTMSGHVTYISKGVTDNYDYYKTFLKEDGTVKVYIKGKNNGASSGYLYTSIYDSRRGSGNIFNSYIMGSNTPKGAIVSDSLILHCRASDTMYFRVESASAFEYDIRYEIVNTSYTDKYANNSFNNAIEAKTNQVLNGHIGYYQLGVEDNNDYYKFIIPNNGSIYVVAEVTNTSGANGYVYVYGYDKRKANGTILSKYVANTSAITAGSRVIDTLKVNCTGTDTFYLRVTSNGCFNYKFKVISLDRKPVASTEHERLGNTVGFRPQFSNATDFIWDFGDGTKSNLKYPTKTFGVGFFTTRLIVSNSVCNFKDTATVNIEVKGVEYYTPDSSGTGGDAIMKIFGGGLDTFTKVTLKKGAIQITPINRVALKNNTQLNVVFDLHSAEEGTYDVIIEIKGKSPITYPGGFKVKPFRYPYTWSEVVGPSSWRINVENKFKLVVGNSGNVNASGVLVALMWPKSVKLKFDTKWFKPPTSGNYTISTPDTTFTFNYKNIQHFYTDTFNTIAPIDSFNGKKYDGYMRMIIIPKIAAGSTYELPLTVIASSSGAQKFITYTVKPNLFGSCATGSWMDVSEGMAVEAADLLDRAVSTSPTLEKSPVGWLTKATKGTTKHMANLGQAMGAFYNYATGVTNSIDESLPADYYANVDAGNAQVTSALIDIGVDKLVDVGADNIMKNQSDNISNFLSKNPNASAKSIEFAKQNLKDINDIRQAVKDIYKDYKDVKDLNDKLSRLSELLKDCPELQKQVDDLKKQMDKDLNPRDPKETQTNSVTSMDPNEIIGPIGMGNARYLNKIDRLSYMITFENVDTAEAAAQIVRIVDTLDLNKYDINTFEFTDFTIGNRYFSIPKGRQEFVLEDSLSPEMRIRVNGRLDKVKGIVDWQFTSIDPKTKDIPVFEGFLPPNRNKPEGEGSVSFTIQPKLTLTDATTISNKASIIFDTNPAIITNTWTNILDLTPPTSVVTSQKGPGIATVKLKFNGSDASSGLAYYNLFVKIDGGEWLSFGGTSADTMLVKFQYGYRYSFCALASDFVGNMENKALTEETTVGMTRMVSSHSTFGLKPNPAGNQVTVTGITEDVEYSILDVSGRVVASGKMTADDSNLELTSLKPGVYIIQVYGREVSSLKLIKAE